jgi:hypothetical protein
LATLGTGDVVEYEYISDCNPDSLTLGGRGCVGDSSGCRQGDHPTQPTSHNPQHIAHSQSTTANDSTCIQHVCARCGLCGPSMHIQGEEREYFACIMRQPKYVPTPTVHSVPGEYPGGYPRGYPGELKPVSATTWGNTPGRTRGIPPLNPYLRDQGVKRGEQRVYDV